MMRDISGYEGEYAVTDDGRVWSYEKSRTLKNGGIRIFPAKFLKPSFRGNHGHQYHFVELYSKAFSVHRLVALTYLPNPKKYAQVNHKDGDRLNNNVSNLEWCNQKQNSQHAQASNLFVQKYGEEHGGHKLSTLAVIAMRRKRSRGAKLVELSKEFRTSVSNVSYICRGETRIYG